MKKIATLLIFTLFTFSSFAATWYYKSGDAALVVNWDSQADGQGGSSPANFTTTTDVFDLNGQPSIIVSSDWTLSGTLLNSGGVTSIFNVTNSSAIVFLGDVQDGDKMICTSCHSINYYYTTNSVDIIPGTYDNALAIRAGVIGIAKGNITAADVETLDSTSILDMATFTLAVTIDNLISGNNGSIKTQNTSATPISLSSGNWNQKIVFNATGNQTVPAFDYQGGLSIEGGGNSIKTAAGNLTIGTSLNIANSTKLELGTNTMTEGTPVLSSITGSGSMETKNVTTSPFPTGKNWADILVFFNATSGSTEYLPAGTYYSIGQVVPGNTLSARGDVSVSTEIADLQGTIDMGVHALSGTFTFKSFGTSATFRTENTSATPFPSGLTFGTGSTVEFYANADQTIPAGTYENLTLTGTSTTTKTTAGALTVNKVLTVEGASTELVLNHVLTAGSAFSNSAGSASGSISIESGSPVGALPSGKTWNVDLTFNKLNYAIPELTFNGAQMQIEQNASLAGDLSLTGSARVEFFGTNTELDCATNVINFLGTGLAESTLGTNCKIQTQAPTGAFTGAVLFGSTLLVEFNAAGVQDIPGGTYRGGLSALNSTKTFTGNVTAAGPLNVTTVIDASSFQLIEESGLTLTITGSSLFYTSNNSSTPVPADLDWSSLAEFQYRTGTTTIVSGIYSSLDLNGAGTRRTAGSSTCADLILNSANATLIISADDYIIENSLGVTIVDASSKIVLEADNSGNYGQLKATAFNPKSGSGKVEKQFYFSPSTGRWHRAESYF